MVSSQIIYSEKFARNNIIIMCFKLNSLLLIQIFAAKIFRAGILHCINKSVLFHDSLINYNYIILRMQKDANIGGFGLFAKN